MSYDYSEKKIVAIIDQDLKPGQAMNALGHLAYSLGRYSEQTMMGKEKILDADGNSHLGITKYPFIVLKATREEIKDIVKKAKDNDILVADFPSVMFDTAHDDELVKELTKAHEPTITYHAALLAGKTEAIKELTGHLKLYR